MFISRFIGVVRIFVPMFAGIARMPFGRFNVANVAGFRPDGGGIRHARLPLRARPPALEHHITEATLIGAAVIVLWFVYTRVRRGGPPQHADAAVDTPGLVVQIRLVNDGTRI